MPKTDNQSDNADAADRLAAAGSTAFADSSGLTRVPDLTAGCTSVRSMPLLCRGVFYHDTFGEGRSYLDGEIAQQNELIDALLEQM